MKSTMPTFILLVLFGLAVHEGHAQMQVGVHGGYSRDAFQRDGDREGTYFVGAQARFGLVGMPLTINPSFDYYFNAIEHLRTVQFDVNALIPLALPSKGVAPYIGAGLGVTRVAFEADPPVGLGLPGSEQTDYGLNLIGGTVMGRGATRFFAQARYTMGHHLIFLDEDGEKGEGLAVMAGLLFRVGH